MNIVYEIRISIGVTLFLNLYLFKKLLKMKSNIIIKT